MEISRSELDEIIRNAVEQTTDRILQQIGLIKTTLRRSEVERLYGRSIFEKSKFYVRWQQKGKSVICQKKDFENYLKKFDIELKRV